MGKMMFKLYNNRANRLRNLLLANELRREVFLATIVEKRQEKIDLTFYTLDWRLHNHLMMLKDHDENQKEEAVNRREQIEKSQYWKRREIVAASHRKIKRIEKEIARLQSNLIHYIDSTKHNLVVDENRLDNEYVGVVMNYLDFCYRTENMNDINKEEWREKRLLILHRIRDSKFWYDPQLVTEMISKDDLPEYQYALKAANIWSQKETNVILAHKNIKEQQERVDARIEELKDEIKLLQDGLRLRVEQHDQTTLSELSKVDSYASETANRKTLNDEKRIQIQREYDNLVVLQKEKTAAVTAKEDALLEERHKKGVAALDAYEKKISKKLDDVLIKLGEIKNQEMKLEEDKYQELSAHEEHSEKEAILMGEILARKNFRKDEALVLQLHNLSMHFGGVKAVDQLSFNVREGEIFGLIGPNGAGKTTVFNCITRFYKPTHGKVFFRNKQNEAITLNDYRVHNVITEGIVRTFQNVELVYELTVLDNLLVGAHSTLVTNVFNHIIPGPGTRRENTNLRFKARHILEKLGLLPYENAYAYGLPYGILKRIELARTLMTNPKLIILDEPAAGLNDTETLELAKLIKWIRDEYKCTIFLVEHDMDLVMSICDRICAISFGKMLAIGTPAEIQNNTLVKEAYLGSDAGDDSIKATMKVTNESQVENETPTVLDIKNLVVSYRAITALKSVNIRVKKGQIVSILGANGAGKSSTIRAISGLVKPKSGSIMLNGKNIAGKPAYTIAASGVCQSPEGRQIFVGLTVEENLKVGAYAVKKGKRCKDENGNTISYGNYIKKKLEEVYHYFPRLGERKKQQASTLSGGEQQMLAIGRALMGNPEILLLDEPSLGLAPLIIADIFEIIKRLRDAGKTILLIEQNAFLTLKISDYAYVLELGSVSMEGKGEDLLRNDALVEAYLGGKKG